MKTFFLYQYKCFHRATDYASKGRLLKFTNKVHYTALGAEIKKR